MHLEKKLIIPELIPLKSLNSSLNIFYTVSNLQSIYKLKSYILLVK